MLPQTQSGKWTITVTVTVTVTVIVMIPDKV
jgi:hypothetical protein